MSAIHGILSAIFSMLSAILGILSAVFSMLSAIIDILSAVFSMLSAIIGIYQRFSRCYQRLSAFISGFLDVISDSRHLSAVFSILSAIIDILSAIGIWNIQPLRIRKIKHLLLSLR